MKSLATAVMLSMVVMASAQAADVEPSRAQVQADLAQAKASGQYTFGEEGYPATFPEGASLSAAQVRDELAQAQHEGMMASGNMDYPPIAQASTGTLSRAQVKADLAQAKAEGMVTFGNMDYPPQHG